MTSGSRLDDLAVLGGAPEFTEVLHVGRPNVGDRRALFERLEQVLDRRWLTNDGPQVRELEARIQDLLGVRHCVATSSGTAGIQVAVRALGITGEVVVPSWTFVATAHALRWLNIDPVFCDVAPDTHNVDVASMEAAIGSRVSAILAVHLWGRPAPIVALEELAARRGIHLILDAAHAFGCSYRGRMVGGFGDAEVFSFHATKFVNSVEGGAVTTNDDALADELRLARNFGFTDYDATGAVGTNAKMNEFSAAMGNTSLDGLTSVVAENRRCHEDYRGALSALPGLRVLEYAGNESFNFQYTVVEVDPAATGISRDDLYAVLWAENVRARRYFRPGCHRLEPYRSELAHAAVMLPNTEHLSDTVLCLPTGPSVTTDAARRVCAVIELAIAHGPELSDRLTHDASRMASLAVGTQR